MKTDLTRLYITPLTPDLLPTILGTSLLPFAKNISYHELQTFSETNYGYVELPQTEAEKVKNKLNGAMLKGKKIRIEDAKPRKRKHEELEPACDVESPPRSQPSTKSKKKERKERILPGHELSPDRKVKRGWTEAKKSKKDNKISKKADQQKSKYTNKNELLFRTKLPENKADNVSDSWKKQKKRTGPDVVHEFEKSARQPTFIKQSEGKQQKDLQYVDGQGWVDANGQVVEAEPANVKARRSIQAASGPFRQTRSATATKDSPKKDQNPTSGPADDKESSSEDDGLSSTSASSSIPSTPAAAEGLGVEIPEQAEPHPLEALFKKPQKPGSSQDIVKPSLELATSNFSFFDLDTDRDDVDEDQGMPSTPYNSQDVRSRGLRSAAPTPDTAHPSRFNSYGSSGLPGDEESSDEGEQSSAKTPAGTVIEPPTSSGGRREPSDFEKMFWEKRGDNNRAWKARRRTVLKEKRQRENRSRRPRNW